MINLSTIRRRLEVQSFLGLTDDELKSIGPWMRFTPVLNLTFTVMATALSSISLLVGLAILMAAGAIMPIHPFDALYNAFVRRITRTQPLPKSICCRRRVAFTSYWRILVWYASSRLLTRWPYGSSYSAACHHTFLCSF